MRRSALIVTLALSVWTCPVRAEDGPAPGRGPVALLAQDAEGHPFHLESTRGQVVAIIVLSRYTSKQAAPIQDALGAMVAPRQVEVISVVDLIGIPRTFQRMARHKVIAGSKSSPMHFLVDDAGVWRAHFGVQPDKRVDILVLDRQGDLRGHFVGTGQLGAAERLIRTLRE